MMHGFYFKLRTLLINKVRVDRILMVIEDSDSDSDNHDRE